MDRHRFWERVSSHHAYLERVAPDGYEPVVEVFLAGRDQPVVPAYVETSRSAEYPWLVLQARSAGDQPADVREPDEYWVHVPEGMIVRVEIRFAPKGQHPIGFGVRQAEEPGESTQG
jgi:hypothetical protein